MERTGKRERDGFPVIRKDQLSQPAGQAQRTVPRFSQKDSAVFAAGGERFFAGTLLLTQVPYAVHRRIPDEKKQFSLPGLFKRFPLLQDLVPVFSVFSHRAHRFLKKDLPERQFLAGGMIPRKGIPESVEPESLRRKSAGTEDLSRASRKTGIEARKQRLLSGLLKKKSEIPLHGARPADVHDGTVSGKGELPEILLQCFRLSFRSRGHVLLNSVKKGSACLCIQKRVPADRLIRIGAKRQDLFFRKSGGRQQLPDRTDLRKPHMMKQKGSKIRISCKKRHR